MWLDSELENPQFEQVFSLRANLFADYNKFINTLMQYSGLHPSLLELCRLRIAQLHNCAAEFNRRYRLADQSSINKQIENLAQWPKSELFSQQEKACLHIAELFTMDPHSISDEDTEQAKRTIFDKGLVALMEAFAMFDGFCRFQLLLEIQPGGDIAWIARDQESENNE